MSASLARWLVLPLAAMLAFGLRSAPAAAQSAEPDVLAREQILILPVGLQPSPAHQTVPKNTATIVKTAVAQPGGAGAPQLPADAIVTAQLRGPALGSPVILTARPNEPITIPPLALVGLYAVENIRLVSAGRTLLQGVPDAVTIEVIDKVIVSDVTARPLTAQEIRDKGIVVDETNFQVVNFTAAFGVEGHRVNIDLPVIVPTQRGGLNLPAAVPALSLPPLQPAAAIATSRLPELQLALQTPSVSVSGMLLRIEDSEVDEGGLGLSIPAAIIIPGNIAFLNQFFSVLLLVSNVAPARSNLVVRDVRAEITLPTGRDTVADTGDDPLRMARLGTPPAPQPRIQPVARAGPDGKAGTADDIPSIAPAQSGEAEFLVEGVKEGSHNVDVKITAMLDGLPGGPVKISGRAVGTVEVRNPTFALTLLHPQTVGVLEEYDFSVVVTNTSTTPANFVSLSLLPRSISGAQLAPGQSESRTFETIAAGDSATATFRLVALTSGTVTSTSFASDDVPGKFELRNAVGALGIPMSPNTLVLPPPVDRLPAALRNAGIALLGQAFALATSPVTPEGLLPITQQIVYERATDLATAGQRVELGEALASVIRDLTLDFTGNDFTRIPGRFAANDQARVQQTQQDFRGFDELSRRSGRGAGFFAALGDLFATQVQSQGALAFHEAWARTAASRPPHVSVITGSASGGPVPVILNVTNPATRRLGVVTAGSPVLRNVPFGAFLSLNGSGPPQSQMALLGVPDPGAHVVELIGTAPGEFDLGVMVPEGPRLRRLTYENVPVQSGGKAHLRFTLGGDNAYLLEVDDTGDGVADRQLLPLVSELVADPGPTLLSAIQVVTHRNDLSVFGQLIGLLFSEPVSEASSQSGLEPGAITSYGVEANQVVAASLQPGGRVLLLSLRDGIGTFVTRTITVSGITDRAGNVMAPATLPIVTVLDNGGSLSGQVRRGDGSAVPRARIRLAQQIDSQTEVTISVKDADNAGRYAFDFITRLPTRLEAFDLETGERGEVRTQVGHDGQALNVDIILLGTGRLVGRALATNGTTVLAGAVVRVTSLTRFEVFSAVTDQSGAFSISGIPVGNVTIEAVHVATQSKRLLASAIPSSGATAIQDLVLIPLAQQQIETGTLKGQVFRADGVSPVAGIPVFTSLGGIATTDATGSYRIEGLPATEIAITALDQARLEQGSVRTTVVAGVEITANVLLFGGTGTVTGVVLDADGQPVAGVLVGGGLSIATTDASGQFVLADVPVGPRQISALDQARQLTASASITVSGPGEEVTVQLVLEARGTLVGRVFEANGTTPVPSLRVFLLGARNLATVTDANGGYRFENIPLGGYTISAFRSDFSDGNVAVAKLVFKDEVRAANVSFRGKGRVAGIVLAADGVTPLGATVGLSELRVKTGNLAPPENPFCAIQGNIQVGDVTVEVPQCVPVGIGFESARLTRIVGNDVASGTFTYDNVFVGGFTVEAANAFSPTIMAASGTIAKAGDTVNVTLQLVATSEVRGTVFQPDGMTPVGKDVVVTFDSASLRDVRVVTDEQGKYRFPLVNAGAFTVTADDPVTGLTGRSSGGVAAGRSAEIPIRLLGLGTVTVEVRGSSGVIAGAQVTLQRGTFPGERRQRATGADGKTTFAGGDAVTEGPFSVSAISAGVSGFTGGVIPGPDGHVDVQILLPDEAGTVRGTLVKADGTTRVPNAQIHLASAGGDAFTTTDVNGEFVFAGVRKGAVVLEAFDATTARRGRSTGQVSLNLEVVTIDIVEVPQGTVKGFVRLSKDLTPVPGAEVSISVASVFGASFRTTAGQDGAFTLPGVSAGTFSLGALDALTGLSGSAAGALATEGQEVTLDVLLQVPALGRIEGVVTKADGSGALNAQVMLDGVRTTTVDNAGFYFFDRVPVGTHAVLATAGLGPDAGVGSGQVAFDGDVARVDVTFVGTGMVTGTVRSGAGAAIAFARVVLTRKTATPRSFAAETLTGAEGRFEFESALAGDLSVTATQSGTLLAGTASGTLSAAGTLDLSVVLEPAASVRGRVLRQNGLTAAGGMALELTNGSRRFGASAGDGTFEFKDLSLASYTLTVTDPLGTGIVRATVSLTAQGQVADLGDLVLDEAPPTVVSISPADGATGVPVTRAIEVVFSEPVDPATIGAPTLRVSDADGAIAGAWVLDPARTRASFTPAASYRDFGRISVKVTTAVKDRVGKPLAQEAVASFVTADSMPPSFVSVSPASGARDIALESVIRVAYSEAIDPARFGAPAITLSRNGTAVGGRLDFILSNTVAVFTPSLPLSPNATYRVVLAPATDLFGNVQPAPTLFDITTLDTEPPAIAALAAAGGTLVAEGATVTITPDLGGATDVAFVEFLVNAQLVQTQRAAPFALNLPITAAQGASIAVGARATDLSGNAGPLQTLTLTVQADQPPTASILAPATGAMVGSGGQVAVRVRVADDRGVAQIALQATGAASTSSAIAVTPPVPLDERTFNVTIPGAASPGSIVVLRAVATDTAGKSSPASAISLVVVDAVAPTVRIVSPLPGAKVKPGESVNVLVSAEDSGSVASVRLQATGAATFAETRAVSPALSSVVTTFQVPIPADAVVDQVVTLAASAQDTAGNGGGPTINVTIADAVAPVITALRLPGGGTQILPGQTVTVQAVVTDNVGVSAVDFTTEGVVTGAGTVGATPPAPAATLAFVFTIPGDAPFGGTVTVRARARDAQGNTSAQASLILTLSDTAPPAVIAISPPEDTAVPPGQAVIITVQATDDVAVRRIAFSASGVLSAEQAQLITPAASPAEATFQLAIPAGTAPGSVTLSVTAEDAAGKTSAAVLRRLRVPDIAPPTVLIASPGANVQIDPRAPLAVSVDAGDNSGIAQVSFTASGVVAVSETRAITPAVTATTQTFNVIFAPLPLTGGLLTLSATARDAAGNQGSAPPVTVAVRDVVPPEVTSISPAAGATGIERNVSVLVQFSEAIGRDTVTAATMTLSAGGAPVPATFSFSSADRIVTLTPLAPPLPANTLVTLRVETPVTDVAGNGLAAPFTASFTTKAADTTGPRVAAIAPESGATDVSIATAIQVTFTEPVNPATINATSFRVSASGAAVAGAFSFLSGNAAVRFTPQAALPLATLVTTELTAAITDVAANALTDATGAPLAQPLAFTFTTGSFAIASPANGSSVPEKTTITLDARGGASLGIATVTFAVNGQALPPAAGPPFIASFTTPPAATTPTLTIVATARTGGGAQVAQDQVVVDVVPGLSLSPAILGVPVGGAELLRVGLTSPLGSDLFIDLSAVIPGVVAFAQNPIVLPAGQAEVSVTVNGVAVGNTTLLAQSTRGTAAAIVSVSVPVPQQELTALAPPASVIVQPPVSLGALLGAANALQTTTLLLLAAPAGTDTPVIVTSSNVAVASVVGVPVIATGTQVATLTIQTGTDGQATLTLRAGGEVGQLTVLVGPPPPGRVPLVIAAPVAVTILSPPSLGAVLGAANAQQTTSIALLPTPAPSDTQVIVTSSNPAVASVVGIPVIATGTQVATLTILTGTDGEATLTLRAGGEVRQLTVFVGPPPPGRVPLVIAAPVAVTVQPPPSLGAVLGATNGQQTTTLALLPTPATSDTPVLVTSSNPAVASVVGIPVIATGTQVATLTIQTGVEGEATLTLRADGEARQLTVFVGPPPPGRVPLIMAPPVGLTMLTPPSLGQLIAPAGSQQVMTVPLLSAPAPAETEVTVSSSDPAIASVQGSVVVPAGQQSATLTIVTGGEGVATLTLRAPTGEVGRFTVIVGTPPPGAVPLIVAPPVGVEVQ